ncbi:hypothetical protein PR048_031079 [Dryococelus australis]|uniref:Uncharacterized protein n=1 Tax=Dryococelus australis TaxID=614101 RepID=A0ABQ9G493_9NEOP|nr:hypothetical protein PR048_031079 [Dryococelus australis]
MYHASSFTSEKLGSCAHVIRLHRTQHGPFTERDALSMDRWTAAHILEAIRASRDTHHSLLHQETSQLR